MAKKKEKVIKSVDVGNKSHGVSLNKKRDKK